MTSCLALLQKNFWQNTDSTKNHRNWLKTTEISWKLSFRAENIKKNFSLQIISVQTDAIFNYSWKLFPRNPRNSQKLVPMRQRYHLKFLLRFKESNYPHLYINFKTVKSSHLCLFKKSFSLIHKIEEKNEDVSRCLNTFYALSKSCALTDVCESHSQESYLAHKGKTYREEFKMLRSSEEMYTQLSEESREIKTKRMGNEERNSKF